MVTFQGRSVEEAESAFHDSVDDYLEWCAARCKEPEKALQDESISQLGV